MKYNNYAIYYERLDSYDSYRSRGRDLRNLAYREYTILERSRLKENNNKS